MAYSLEFRKRAIEYMDKGHTKEELYEAFKIYPPRVSAWRKLLRETGSLEPQYSETRVGKIDLQKLEQAIAEKPDAYLCELAKQFGCTKQAIFYALKRLKISYKKNFHIHREM